jgi:hypothetical protein
VIPDESTIKMMLAIMIGIPAAIALGVGLLIGWAL